MLQLLKGTQFELADYIKKNNYEVYIYGAGMIGKIVIPNFCIQFGIENNIKKYIDQDIKKNGSIVNINQNCVEICRLENIKPDVKRSLLIISNSDFNSIVNMLDSDEKFNGLKTVIFPVLQTIEINNKKNIKKNIIKDYSNDMIPKVIHYFWFSKKDIPDNLKKCISNWKSKCFGYDIVRWDENNYDITKNDYVRHAYELGKWSFVSDYARLDILYNYGGFYLDTDVELLKSLDSLRKQGAFCGVEKWGNINTGGCCGAIKHHKMIGKMLEYRENIKFNKDDFRIETNGFYETIPFLELGMKINNTVQRINNMTIFPSDFFHPYDYMSGQTVLTSNTFSIHHFDGGWMKEESLKNRQNTEKAYKEILNRMWIIDH